MLLLKRLLNKSKIHFPGNRSSYNGCIPLHVSQSLPEENHLQVIAFCAENVFSHIAPQNENKKMLLIMSTDNST